MSVQNYYIASELPLEDLGNGVTRKVLAYNKQLMSVELHFEKGAIGAMHSHPHEQISYVVSGAFEFTIGDKKCIVRAGDTTYKQPDVPHGAVCLEQGVLIDIFTPMRDDFIK